MGGKEKAKEGILKKIKAFDRHRLFLILIYLLTFSFLLVYSMQTAEFSSSSSYNTLRNVQSIINHGTPLYQDDLSYGGREHISAPLFYYVLAFFSLFMPLAFVGKIIPALLASTIVIIVYLIAKKISNNRKVALLSAFMSGFIPVLTSLTLNTITPYSLAIPLLMLSFYFFTRIDEGNRYVIYFVIAFLLSLLTHPITILLIASLLIYLAITRIEDIETSPIETEVILFSTFFMFWTYFIIYKQVLLNIGPSIIWQNIPISIRAEYFSDFNILAGIINIGIIPFLFGMYIVYAFFFKYKSKTNFLYISLTLSTLFVLWLRMVELKVGLSILAIMLVLLFSFFYKNLLIYLEKTKFSHHTSKILLIMFLLFTVTSVVPTFIQADSNIKNAFSSDETAAMIWIRDNTEPGSTVLADVYEGSFISFKAERKNVADTDFLMIDDTEERLKDIETIYTTPFETEALPLLDKYGVDYILFSERIMKEYDVTELKYAGNTKCFSLLYRKGVEVYTTRCSVEEVPED